MLRARPDQSHVAALGLLCSAAIGCESSEPGALQTDAAQTADAAAPIDAARDAMSVLDATQDAAQGLDAAGHAAQLDGALGSEASLGAAACPSPPELVTDAGCAPSGLSCQRKYRCYNATAVGPVGTDGCECNAGRWSCSDTCAAWSESLRDR